MNFKDYIQGKRQGKEANKLEREALNDPFLQDAIDGFDSVQGNHDEIIEALESKINQKSNKRKYYIRYTTLSIAATIALLIGISIIFQNQNQEDKNITQETFALSEEDISDTTKNQELAIITEKESINGIEKTLAKKTTAPTPQIKNEVSVEVDDVEISENVIAMNSEMDIQSVENTNAVGISMITDPTKIDSNKNEKKINDTTQNNSNKFITGIVLDETGQPIVGASINLNNKNKSGTVTDLNGRFVLQKTDGDKILASYIGYNSKSVVVKSDSNIIKLEPNTLALNEVVTVSATRKMKTSKINVDETLQGKAAGINVNSKQNKFGKEEFKQFLFKNLKDSICQDTVYTITATFKTDSIGKPYDVKIIKSNCDEFENEFIRILNESPAWSKTMNKIKIKITKQ